MSGHLSLWGRAPTTGAGRDAEDRLQRVGRGHAPACITLFPHLSFHCCVCIQDFNFYGFNLFLFLFSNFLTISILFLNIIFGSSFLYVPKKYSLPTVSSLPMAPFQTFSEIFCAVFFPLRFLVSPTQTNYFTTNAV